MPAPDPAEPTPAGATATQTPHARFGRLLLAALEDGSLDRAMGTRVTLFDPFSAQVTTRSYTVSDDGITLIAEGRLLSADPDRTYRIEERFDANGLYLGYRQTSSAWGSREFTVAGCEGELREVRNGDSERTTRLPLGPDFVSPGLLFDVLPALHDRLPAEHRWSTVWRDANDTSTPADLLLRWAESNGEVVLEVSELDPQPIRIHVTAAGPQRGRVTRLIDGDRRPQVVLAPAEGERFLAQLPLQRNSWAAIRGLREIAQAQFTFSVMRPGETEPGPFATTLAELEEDLPEGLARGQHRGYAFVLVAQQQPTPRWLAIANPLPGQGLMSCALTQDGTLHASPTPLEVTPDCSLPPGTEPLD